MAKRPLWQRRAMLAGGLVAAIGWVKIAPYLATSKTVALEFKALPSLAPFRTLVIDGPSTSAASFLAGLDTAVPLTLDQKQLDISVRSKPCTALFGADHDNRVPIAIFSDFACPNCRLMETRIAELGTRDPDLFRIVRHQLPILGVASITASRAVLAAENQGAYSAMHDRLIRTPAITDLDYVTSIAADIGLDPKQFRSDLTSPDIDHALRQSQAIARVFGFYGTPAFAVGRTTFQGAIPTSTLRALIAGEDGFSCQTS